MSGVRRALAALRVLRASDAGMSTAEYCVCTVAVCAFGAVLYKILTSNWAYDIVKGLISSALHLVHL